MLKHTYLVCLSIFVMSIHTAFSQTIKVGDKFETLIKNVWTEVKVTRVIPGTGGNSPIYMVETLGTKDRQGVAKNSLQVGQSKLRTIKVTGAGTPVTTSTTEPPKTVDPHLGKYELYSGIPSMYIGHLVLLTGGKYKVALSTDEANYEFGNYSFDASTNTIEWQNGLFKNNNWKGKLVNTSGNNFRIEFNKVTFADSN